MEICAASRPAAYSPLMLADLMIGHHYYSISVLYICAVAGLAAMAQRTARARAAEPAIGAPAI